MKSKSLKKTLILCCTLIGLIPLTVLALVSYFFSSNQMEQQSFNQLEAVNAIKKGTITDYFQSISDQVETLSANLMIVDALREFNAGHSTYREENNIDEAEIARMREELRSYYNNKFGVEFSNQTDGKDAGADALLSQLDDNGVALQYAYIQNNSNALGSKHMLDAASDGSAYSQTHAKYHPIIRAFLEKFGYYDIFLVDADSGDIVYSVFKELDYSTSLLSGAYADTNFAETFKQAVSATDPNAVVLVDFEQYRPSYDAPASFIASPVFDGGEKLGVLIFQMPIDRITSVMSERAGMGETGESYLVGSDMLMRSDSFLDPENHSVIASMRNPESGAVDTEAARKALAGEKGTKIITDYNGNSVLSSYEPINILGLEWAILSEIDEAEALAGVTTLGYISIGLFVLVGLICVVVSFLIARSIANPIISISAAIQAIAKGDLNVDIDVSREDEVGQLGNAMNEMKSQLVSVIQNEIQPLVAKAGAGDLKNRIQLDKKEGFYRELGSSINELIDVNESFLNDTVTMVSALANGDLKTTVDTQYQGSFAQVQDDIQSMRTKLIEVISNDVQAIVDAAGEGDLSQRIDLDGKMGFYHDLSAGINNLIDMNESIINDTIRVTSALSRGDLSESIEAKYKGSFARLQNDVTAMQTKLSQVIEEDIQAIVMSASQGDLKQRIDLGDKQGFYKELSASINNLVNTSDEIITDTSTVIAAMATGDLTQTIKADYKGIFGQLKNDINTTVGKLSLTVTEIQSAASSVNVGASEISTGSTSLSQRTEEQAASLEETSAAMEEISTTVQQTADNAREAKSLAREAREVAEKGGLVVSDAINAMTAISESSNQISNIISVIDEIAFQTNLLALNAAVEAARAGDQGRGFAVVAEEVRGLAGRSAEAAKEIKELIRNSSAKVDEGATLVNKSGETLADIVGAIQKVSSIVEEISMATDEQSTGLEEINRAVIEMDEMTQQNAALVEETAAASESLGEQSQSLDMLVGFFNVDPDKQTPSIVHNSELDELAKVALVG